MSTSNLNLLINSTNKTTQKTTNTIIDTIVNLDNLELNGNTKITNLETVENANKLFTISPSLKLNQIDYQTGKVPVTVNPLFGASLSGPQIYELYYQRIGNMVYCWGIFDSLTITSGGRRDIRFIIPFPRPVNFFRVDMAGGYAVGDRGFGYCGLPFGQWIRIFYTTPVTFTSKISVHAVYQLTNY